MQLNENPNEDFLIGALIELSTELKKVDIKCIVGGGFAQHIRAKYFTAKISPRYKFRILQRTTKDIDFFLTSDLITKSEDIESVKGIVQKLNYKVVTKYFQYSKQIMVGEQIKEVGLDILTEPPKSSDIDKVRMNKPPRVRPINVKEFHAFQHNEAKGLEKYLIKVSDFVDEKDKDKFENVYIPSAIQFIIMKLFAFRDRVDDELKDFGRHHAFDIFSTIVSMTEYDWANYERKIEFYDSVLTEEAHTIVEKYFSDSEKLGVLRIRENKIYKNLSHTYDEHLNLFLEDLATLFGV
ncbi:MAG: hypothetical protein M5R37_09815 [Melioribacteraceae bacterium]|nr:hypothetical protein [Melioribacteraceae bacterium]